MKEINQIIHLTNSKEALKNIVKNGFYTSYAKETFGSQNILIPMISFANILFRDIGHNEVVDYGKYGLVFDRDFVINEFDLNPVIYVKNDSNIDQIFSYNFQTSIIPQTLHLAKDFYQNCNCERFSEHIKIEPISDEVKSLLDTLDTNVNDEFIDSIKLIFENYFENTLKQILLLKPFKVTNKNGESKIAYNEREWRKSFFELNYVSEFKPNGTENDKYNEIINLPKPHFRDNYVQEFNCKDLKCIYVETNDEVNELKEFISENINEKIDVYTLKELIELENI